MPACAAAAAHTRACARSVPHPWKAGSACPFLRWWWWWWCVGVSVRPSVCLSVFCRFVGGTRSLPRQQVFRFSLLFSSALICASSNQRACSVYPPLHLPFLTLTPSSSLFDVCTCYLSLVSLFPLLMHVCVRESGPRLCVISLVSIATSIFILYPAVAVCCRVARLPLYVWFLFQVKSSVSIVRADLYGLLCSQASMSRAALSRFMLSHRL
jgi:hypothetical protein